MSTFIKTTPLTSARREANEPSASPIPQAASFPQNLPSTIEQRARELEDALHERDMVVQMLTQRLEQAADQLDRVQRTGSDRRSSATSGVPPELIEGQQTLLDQMNRLLGEWEDLQAGSMLSRIESQISELKDLVSSGPPTGGSSHARSTTGPSNSPANVHAETAPAGWEAIKAAMMAGESSGSSMNSTTNSAPTVAASTPVLASQVPSGATDAPPALPDPPPFVDVDQAAIDVLRVAVQVRDEYISMLIRRIVAQDQSTRLPDWEALNQAPADLRCELDNLRQQLQQKLRIAEVDLSLQRARFAREEAKLQVKADQVTRQMRQAGLPTDEAAATTSSAPNQSSDGQQGRRWMQFLQRSSAPNPPADGS